MAGLIQYDEGAPINFNVVKEYFTDALAKEGFISKEQAELIKHQYAIIVVRRHWLGRLIDKVLFKEGTKDEYKIVVAKIVF